MPGKSGVQGRRWFKSREHVQVGEAGYAPPYGLRGVTRNHVQAGRGGAQRVEQHPGLGRHLVEDLVEREQILPLFGLEGQRLLGA